MKMTTIKVESRFGVTIHNLFLTHDAPSDKLLIMLPGRGYTCEHPVMYYLRRSAMMQGYDVLSVQYGFQVANVELNAENAVYLQDDVRKAVEQTLPGGYREVCVAGKSLGTPLAAELARSLTNDSVSLIMLTPIGGAMQGLGDIRTLAIVGTADPLYRPEEVAAYENHAAVTWKVFEKLNHALEDENDWRNSLAALQNITGSCEVFLG
jgi:esterase/lipase